MGIDRLVVQYPFLERARQQLQQLPPTDASLPQQEILEQARYRLQRAITIANSEHVSEYRPYQKQYQVSFLLTNTIEFYSFFVAVMAASSDGFLTKGLAEAETQRIREIASKAGLQELTNLLIEATGNKMTLTIDGKEAICPMENYLMVGTKYGFFNSVSRQGHHENKYPTLKLGAFAIRFLPSYIDHGQLHIDRNKLLEMFLAVANEQMFAGMRALRNRPVPEFVKTLTTEIQKSPYIPPAPVKGAGYDYVERLLKAPTITDARHRTIWLVLAPYYGVVKGFDEKTATEKILEYIKDARYRTYTTYHVKRAIRYGLKPPSAQTIRDYHKDLVAAWAPEVLGK